MDTGFELCGSQYMRRREVVACPDRGSSSGCELDDPENPCQCVTDDDCGDGYLCECDESVCVPATCRSPADCGGLECRAWSTGCNHAYACATETDVCRMVEDCYPERTCRLDDDGRPACVDEFCDD